ncbi:MAG: rod shape-determining protein MreC [Firmicutes bacterium]|nr:rod shape-determining protein MreC [Bacillota bacterium]
MRWIREHKLIASLLAVLVILALAFVVSMASGIGGNSVSNVVNSGNTGVASFFANIGGNIKDGVTGIINNKNLKAEIDQLEEEKAELERELAEAKLEASELEQLKELSGLLNYDYTEQKFNVVSADVTLVDRSSWTEAFTIDRGSEAGIKNGAIVINGVGLVGKICEVGEGWAKVKPILAEENSVSFMLARSNEQLGVATGGKNGEYIGYMFDEKSTVAESDILVTSGMGVYPAGIEIGNVTSVSFNDDKLIKEVTIEPVVDFNSLRKVAVII